MLQEHFKGMGKEFRLAFCHRMKRPERECREREVTFDILLTATYKLWRNSDSDASAGNDVFVLQSSL